MANSAQIFNFPSSENGNYLKADIEKGFDRLAHDITDTLANPPVKLSAREYQLIMAIISKTYRFHKKIDWIANGQLSELTGIDESNISKLKNGLISKRVVVTEGRKIGINPVISEWSCSEKLKTTTEVKNDYSSQKRLTKKSKTTKPEVKNDSLQKKETITKEIEPKGSTVDPDQVMVLFNEILGLSLSKVQKLNPNRKTLIRARSKDLKTLDDWRDYFLKIQHSDFLTGRKSNWKAGFDWILKDSNSLKIIEGNYDNAPHSGTSQFSKQAQIPITQDFNQSVEGWDL